MKLSRDAQIGYIAGATDVYSLLGEEENIVTARFYTTCIKGMNLTQIHAIVEKYLKEHPEEWHNGMAFLVLKAVGKT